MWRSALRIPGRASYTIRSTTTWPVCTGATLLDGVLELSPAQPDGFIRQTRYRGLSPEKHLGYAVQWFALGLTALILFLVLNFKKKA